MNTNDYFAAAYENDEQKITDGFERCNLNPNLEHPRGGFTLLQAACEMDAVEVIVLLLDRGADANKRFCKYDVDDRPILKDATALASVRSERAAGILLDAGADVDAIDGFGLTPIIHAAKRRNIEVVGYLKGCGANCDRSLYVDGKHLLPREILQKHIEGYEKIAGSSPSEQQGKFISELYQALSIISGK